MTRLEIAMIALAMLTGSALTYGSIVIQSFVRERRRDDADEQTIIEPVPDHLDPTRRWLDREHETDDGEDLLADDEAEFNEGDDE